MSSSMRLRDVAFPAILLLLGSAALPVSAGEKAAESAARAEAAADRAEVAASRSEAAATKTEKVAGKFEAEVDRALERSLEREYGDTDREEVVLPPPPPPRPRVDRGEAPCVPAPVEFEAVEEEEPFRATLMLVGGLQAANLRKVAVQHAEWPGERVRLEDIFSFDHEVGLYTTGVISLGDHLDILGGCTLQNFRTRAPIPTDFSFDRVDFRAGNSLRVRVESLVTDLSLRVNIVNIEEITLGVDVGARYVYLGTHLRDLDTGQVARNSLESVIPTVGLSLVVRPVRVLEFFGSIRGGGYDVESIDRDRSRDAESFVAEAGVAIVAFDTLGIVIGYRYDAMDLHKRDHSDVERARWVVEGPYGAVMLRF